MTKCIHLMYIYIYIYNYYCNLFHYVLMTYVRHILKKTSSTSLKNHKMHFYEYLCNTNVIHSNMRRQFQCKLCSQEIFWRQITGGALGKCGFSSAWLVGGHLLTACARAGDSGFSSSRAGSGRLLMLKLLFMEPIRI